jgi:tripartite-type tricarboxylate transporter receptor subunit TctC
MVARKDLPVNGLQEFIAYAKANQGKMQYGSAGAGSTGFIDCALFNSAIGLNITHVPYRGGGPAMQDLMGGRIDYFCTLTGTAVPQIENGSIKAVAIMTRDRAPMLPNVPSTWEQGFKDFEASTWFGFYVPKGTPTGVIKRLHDATVEAINTPSVQEQLLKSGSIVTPPARRSTEYMKTFTESEIKKNGAPIKAAGLSIE